jgi:hypothetical protein
MKDYGDRRKYSSEMGFPTPRAQAADFIYAKGRLVNFCEELGVPYVQFETFSDIIRHENQVSGLLARGAESRKE